MSDPGPIACGLEITTDTVLDGDLVCDRGPALVIVADGVTLDLGGHTVKGASDRGSPGPGIVLRGVSGSTVRNGTVERFEAGVAVEGGAGNVIEGLTVQDNVGDPDGDFGDGIVINNSRENRVLGNVLRRNGPFSGIALDGLPLRAPGNSAMRNRGRGNGEFDGSDGTLMPPCGRNVWDDNDFGTVNQPCVSRRQET